MLQTQVSPTRSDFAQVETEEFYVYQLLLKAPSIPQSGAKLIKIHYSYLFDYLPLPNIQSQSKDCITGANFN